MSLQGIGGDDRCGVYALNKIYEMSTVKPFLLFTCNEEIDKKGTNYAVYYDCANLDFEKYISKVLDIVADSYKSITTLFLI